MTRRQFLDRHFTIDELAGLADMVRRWFLLRAGPRGAAGTIGFEAAIYAFPRSRTPSLAQALGAGVASAAFDASDPDELRVAVPVQPIDAQPEIALWQRVLAEPLVQQACVRLIVTLEGPVGTLSPDRAVSSFILCGQPAGGGLLVKALWRLGGDDRMQQIFCVTPWKPEREFLAAFDEFCQHRAADPHEAAVASLRTLGAEGKHLAMSARDEARVMRFTAAVAELPDERPLIPFLRRLGVPLLAAAGLLAFAFLGHPGKVWYIRSLSLGCLLAVLTLWVAASKLRQIGRYRSAMRRGLGALFSRPVDFKAIDLSRDTTPTLLKYTAEIEALGGRRLCDMTLSTATDLQSGQRVFLLDDTVIILSLLRGAQGLAQFPAKPLLFLSTHFQDGRRPFTTSGPLYRRRALPSVTGTCLLDGCSAADVIAAHRRHVERLIAGGAVPAPLPATPAQLFEVMRAEHEEGRRVWQTSPYSWGDALHEAFKIPRREYRPIL